jgi:hypothetical protein
MQEIRNEQRTYNEVLADAVRVLTDATRRAVAWTDADGVEHREQADCAEFVTHALAQPRAKGRPPRFCSPVHADRHRQQRCAVSRRMRWTEGRVA